jgi:hypothetical protein
MILWIVSVNSSDRVKSVLRSEILCGYPALRFLRVTDNYQNELHQLQTKINGEVTVNELLLFAQDLGEKYRIKTADINRLGKQHVVCLIDRKEK